MHADCFDRLVQSHSMLRGGRRFELQHSRGTVLCRNDWWCVSISSFQLSVCVLYREDLPIAFSVVVRVSSSHLKYVSMLPTLCVGLCVFRRAL